MFHAYPDYSEPNSFIDWMNFVYNQTETICSEGERFLETAEQSALAHAREEYEKMHQKEH